MKKVLLLFMGASLSMVSLAQNKTNASLLVGHAFDKAPSDVQGTSPSLSTASKKTRQTLEAFPTTFGKKEVVGSTSYDLQTNGSMQRRVQQSGNTVSCGWTMSKEQGVLATSPFADRGTGYAHYNGTSWSAAPTTRLESVRTGFGGFAGEGGAQEYYISHDATGFQYIRATKSGGTWTSGPLSLSTVSQAIWPASSKSGDWLYIIGSANDTTIHSNGIRNGYFFARSNDNGATWLDNNIPMPLIDSTGHYRGGGNSYAIASSGSHVAIAFGDIGTDLTLLTSSDNGATWSKKVIWDWPINNYNFAGTDPTDFDNDAIVDTLWTNDGSHSLTINAAGDVHVAFPLVRVYKDGSSTGYSFFYSTYLAYYNTVMDSVQLLSNIFNTYYDCDKDNTFGLGRSYTGTKGAIYNTIGLLNSPSITLTTGTPERILIAYTAVMDGDTTVDDFTRPYWLGASNLEGQNNRDIMVIGSNDGAASWTYPVNISRTRHFEEMYPSTPERVSGNTLAVLYQGDIEPGTILQNDDDYDPAFENMMICQMVNIDSIFILGADSTAPCGQFELPLSTTTVAAMNGDITVYPNPASDLLNVTVNLVNTSRFVVYEITDMTGKVIFSETRNNIKNDINKINVNGFASGTYLLKVSSDQGSYTHKLIKQ